MRSIAFCITAIITLSALGAYTETSVSYYADSRSFNSATLLTATDCLPFGFRIWGFVDLLGSQNRSRLDATRNFVEYRLIRTVWRVVELHAEYNDANGEDNNLLRFGIGIKPRFRLRGKPNWLLVRFSPYETDKTGQQLTLAWSVPAASRIALNGFADWNLQRDGGNRWVVEPELAIALTERFTFVVELRYNGFEVNRPEVDGTGIAIGGNIKF